MKPELRVLTGGREREPGVDPVGLLLLVACFSAIWFVVGFALGAFLL